MRFARLATTLLLAGCLTSAWAQKEDEDDRPSAAASASPGSQRASTATTSQPSVSLTTEALSRLALEVVPVRRAGMADVFQLTGTVAVNEDRTARLVPRLEGIVRQVYHTLGDRVQKGDELVLMDSTALGTAKVEFLRQKQEVELARAELTRKSQLRDNAVSLLDLLRQNVAPRVLEERTRNLVIGEHRARLLTANSNLRLARSNQEREKLLFQQRVNSAKTFQEASRDLETAEATFRSAIDEVRYTTELEYLTADKTLKTKEMAYRASRLQLEVLGATDQDVQDLERGKERELSHTTLRAPFAGTIIERRVTMGERVTPDAALFTLADLGQLWVLADVYESDWARLRQGLTASVRVAAHPARVFPGIIRVVPPLVDVATRTARIRIEVDNREGVLAGGMFATIDVAVGRSEALAIPAAAVQLIDGKSTVFVRLGDRSFRAVTITTGRTDDQQALVEVRSGLNLSDMVVAKGSFLLKSELSKEGLQDED